MKFIKSTVIAIILVSFFNVSGQSTSIKHEIGILLGPTFMQTDYGEADNFKSASSNKGVDFGIAYVADFTESRYKSKIFNWLSQHMKTRVELSFSKVKLQHDEARILENNELVNNQFRGTTGDVSMFNAGIFGEWYFMSLAKKSEFQPYFLTGMSFSSAKSSMNVSDFGLPSVYTPTKDKLFLGSNSALSFSYGLGGRYRLDDVDLIFEGRLQTFLSDKIEGIDTNIPGDKNNDSQVLFKIGAIFHLN